MEEKRARGCEDREGAQKKPKLGPLMDAVVSGDSSTNGAPDHSEPSPKKLGPLMDAVVSGDSSTNGAPDHSEPSPKKLGVVYFKHGLAESGSTQLRVFKPQFDKFGKVLGGPLPLRIPQDYAYVIYETPDQAQKAVEEGGGELMCINTDSAILDAVRQAVLDQVRPLLDQAAAHPSNTIVFVSNVDYQSTPEEIKDFFSQFGEIAEGPNVFDLEPDADLEFCLIIYKDEEGAKQAISHPNKDFRGYQLGCSADIQDIINLSQRQVLYDVRVSLEYAEAIMPKGAASQYTPLHHNPNLALALNDVVLAAERLHKAADLALEAAEVLAAERLHKAADLALEAAERFNRATSLVKMPSSTKAT